MKIVICASMSIAPEIIEAKEKLQNLGHQVNIPKNAELYASGSLSPETRKESVDNKIGGDLIKRYFDLIDSSDAILVLNLDKGKIKNYIGGNTFLEIGFAHILKKKIFLFNEVPNLLYKDEILAMKPMILNGNLEKIR